MKKEEYTKQEVLSAMLRLLKYKQFEEISITDLVAEAHVGRASFYRNYKQKEDVLTDHLLFLFEKWGEKFEKEGNHDLNASLIVHFWEEKDFYMTIYKANLGHYIYNAMKTVMKIEEKTNPIEKYISSWYAGSIYGFIDEWMKSGMEESPEEIAGLMKNMFTQ